MSLFGAAESSVFLPHRTCLILREDLIWLHVTADALIALAYFAIPLILLYFDVHRKQRFYSWVLILFASFILLCGLTHVMGIWTMWFPDYYAEGFLKMITAVVSLATALTLLPEIPKLLALRSPEELEAINSQLKREVDARSAVMTNLEDTVSQLQASNKELERFAYITSHDLKAPLRSIASFATLLEKRYGDRFDGEGREFLDYIRSGVEQMQSLTDDLLQLHRVNTTKAATGLVNLNQVVEEVGKQLHGVIVQADAKFSAEQLPRVAGDETQLAILLRNLVGNALKFRATDRQAEIKVSARRSGAHWEISVKDNGIGIAPEQHQQIFETFRRLHTQDEYPGTGIGLSLCSKIVERHGGEIWVESMPGQGSDFRFTLIADPVSS